MTEASAGSDQPARVDATAPAVSFGHPELIGALGVIGGTFDPIHFGHLAIAEEARCVLGLRQVLFVPARQPPHKPGRPISPAEDRVAMVELAIRDNPGFALSRMEIDRPGPSYTVDTLEELRGLAEGAGEKPGIAFILSVEALAGLPSWREPRRLLSLCRLIVAPRPGHTRPDAEWLAANLAEQADRIVFLDGPQLCVSGSEIRRRASRGLSIRYHLPSGVAAYISEHHLYDSDAWRHA